MFTWLRRIQYFRSTIAHRRAMHLLSLNNAGRISYKDFLGDDIPRYAILSHTWGADGEEVTYKDLVDGTGQSKAGYDKIRFCGEQAKWDGLKYFWVDTCCIDKSSSAELQEAINSMFRWYQDAAKCYVYLSDVSATALAPDANDLPNQPWELAFRNSRWFTRGWTLQELIAPTSVKFFSKDGVELGDRESLERHIHEVTGIPEKALRGNNLSDFSVNERMVWAEKRNTTRQEDKAYSLLGIFDVHMPLIYGEGREKSLRRLREEIEKASLGTKREDFSIPFSLADVSETEHFVGREKELEEMHAALSCNGSRGAVFLHGLGGIGKTQLAIAYAKRRKDNYTAVFWLNSKDEDSLRQSFTKLAKEILRKYPSANQLSSVDMDGNLDELIDGVKAWLSLPDNTRWLMVYDNYDNPKGPGNRDPAAVDIFKYFPKAYQGSVIVIARSSQVTIGHSMRIKKLESLQDSLEILSDASGQKELRNDPDAVRLAEELDGLPLALATAGAYINQAAMSFSEYLRHYKASWTKLQITSPELSSYKDRTLYSTWQLSFDHVKQQNELSAMLLRFWAYFNNQDIWFELLRHADSDDPRWIRELTEDELSFNEAVRVLSEHGLVELNASPMERTEARGYSIHGCVHSWTTHVLNQAWDYDLAKLALRFVGSHIAEEDDAKWWLIQRRLLQHAIRSSQLVLTGMTKSEGMEMSLQNLGYLFKSLGKLDEAEEMYQRALQGYEKTLGPNHISTLITIDKLGSLYQAQAKLDEAEKMFHRALQGKEDALGSDHTSTLDTVHNFGLLYQMQGKLEEAEKMYRRALQGFEKVLGTDHTSTLTTVHSLGDLYRRQRKLDEAEKMFQRALHGRDKALGPDHTSTLHTMCNMGSLYFDQHKLEEAEKMYQRALQGYEKALGPGSVQRYKPALSTMKNLGDLFAAQGHPEKAREMYERANSGYLATLGPSSDEIQSLNRKIARLDVKLDKLRQAE